MKVSVISALLLFGSAFAQETNTRRPAVEGLKTGTFQERALNVLRHENPCSFDSAKPVQLQIKGTNSQGFENGEYFGSGSGGNLLFIEVEGEKLTATIDLCIEESLAEAGWFPETGSFLNQLVLERPNKDCTVGQVLAADLNLQYRSNAYGTSKQEEYAFSAININIDGFSLKDSQLCKTLVDVKAINDSNLAWEKESFSREEPAQASTVLQN